MHMHPEGPHAWCGNGEPCRGRREGTHEPRAGRDAHLTKDMPPRRLRFQTAAPMALPTRMAADTAATRAMAHRGKVFGMVNCGSEPSLADEPPATLSSGAAAEAAGAGRGTPAQLASLQVPLKRRP